MAESGCVKCRIRRIYENNPKSLLGRVWKWHTGWCPGWKRYLGSLTSEERAAVVAQIESLARRQA